MVSQFDALLVLEAAAGFVATDSLIVPVAISLTRH
jgi:hypothetical protein